MTSCSIVQTEASKKLLVQKGKKNVSGKKHQINYVILGRPGTPVSGVYQEDIKPAKWIY